MIFKYSETMSLLSVSPIVFKGPTYFYNVNILQHTIIKCQLMLILSTFSYSSPPSGLLWYLPVLPDTPSLSMSSHILIPIINSHAPAHMTPQSLQSCPCWV